MSNKLIEELKASRLPLHEKCSGCNKTDGNVCSIYHNPSAWWKEKPVATKSVIIDHKTLETKQKPAALFFCPMATHLEIVEPEVYKALNPIKASKRKMRGRRH